MNTNSMCRDTGSSFLNSNNKPSFFGNLNIKPRNCLNGVLQRSKLNVSFFDLISIILILVKTFKNVPYIESSMAKKEKVNEQEYSFQPLVNIGLVGLD